MDDFDPCDYEDCRFPRQSKRESAIRKHRKHLEPNTLRNILQKDKQILDSRSRNYRAKERDEKQDGSPRIYYCTACNKEATEPCKCGYIQWCGKECEWEHCNESHRLGIIDFLAVPYDVLCEYHASKFQEGVHSALSVKRL
jgi:hypothetical protein